MSNKIIAALAAVAVVIGTIVPMTYSSDVEAKSFGGSRSFSSSSFSRSTFRSSSSSSKSWGFSSKPSKPSVTKTTPSKSGSFWNSKKAVPAKQTNSLISNKPTGSGTSKIGTAPKKASFQRVGAGLQTKSAKRSLNAQRARFKSKPTIAGGSKSVGSSYYKKSYGSNGVYSRASNYNRDTYYTRRNRYYSSYQPPVYVYNMSPSYGLWDTIFLYSMLNNMNNASSFAYHHQNDADYREWRRAADEQAQTNAELRAQLVAMDAKMSGMKGQSVDPNYLPKGVDADIALSQEARESQKPTFKVCVGSKSGAYFRVASGVMIPGQNVVNMVPVITSGSREVIEKVNSGECDGGFVQSDSYWNFIEHNQTANLPFARVFSPFKEAVHLVCNEHSGVKSINDLDKNTRLYFPTKSGAAETWTNIVAEDDDYVEVPTSLSNPELQVATNEDALLQVNQHMNACALYVAAPGATTLMNNTERGAKSTKTVLVHVNDSDLKDTKDPSGASVYTFGKLTDAKYPNLLRKAGWFGTGFFNDARTVFVSADFIVSDAWKSKNSKEYGQLTNSLIGMSPEISKAVMQ